MLKLVNQHPHPLIFFFVPLTARLDTARSRHSLTSLNHVVVRCFSLAPSVHLILYCMYRVAKETHMLPVPVFQYECIEELRGRHEPPLKQSCNTNARGSTTISRWTKIPAGYQSRAVNTLQGQEGSWCLFLFCNPPPLPGLTTQSRHAVRVWQVKEGKQST